MVIDIFGKKTLAQNSDLTPTAHVANARERCTDHVEEGPIAAAMGDETSPGRAAPAHRSRKFRAVRSPTKQESRDDDEPLIVTSVPPWEVSRPNWDGETRSEIFALVNDRYPGAPGTALAIAREANVKSEQAAKREEERRLADSSAVERLGIKNIGKKRKTTSHAHTASDAGSANGSDLESGSFAVRARSERPRSVRTSRNVSPVPLTSSEHLQMESSTARRVASPRVPQSTLPAHPSPLAVNTR